MELRDLIEQSARIAGSQAALAKVIGVHPNDLSAAKAGKRSLPASACGKLADLLGIDRWTVIAASELVTEKNPEKRDYLAPFVRNLPRVAATWAGLAIAATTASVAPTTAEANDTFKVSSIHEEGAQLAYSDGIRIAVM